MKKLELNDYWSTDSYLSTPIFSRLMKRDILILKQLHFTDNDATVNEGEALVKRRINVDHLNIF